MSEFNFKEDPKEIDYNKKDPLKLHQELFFFHNKSKFRKGLNDLQYLFKENVGVALHAPGIRDTYLREDFTENYLIMVLTTHEGIRKADDIIVNHSNKTIENGCYIIEIDTDFALILAKDFDGITSGMNTLKTILQQTFDVYLGKKQFEEYITIPTLTLYHCQAI